MRGVCPSGQMSVTFMYCRECPRKSCWDSITEDMKRFGPRIVLEDGEKKLRGNPANLCPPAR